MYIYVKELRYPNKMEHKARTPYKEFARKIVWFQLLPKGLVKDYKIKKVSVAVKNTSIA